MPRYLVMSRVTKKNNPKVQEAFNVEQVLHLIREALESGKFHWTNIFVESDEFPFKGQSRPDRPLTEG